MGLASIVQGDFCRDRQARHMCLLVSNYATAATKRALKMQVVQRLRCRLSRSCTFLPALLGEGWWLDVSYEVSVSVSEASLKRTWKVSNS